jgi:N utilization substance protein A
LEQTKKEKMLNRGLDKVELLRIVEAVANEKSIDKEIVLESMESAIQKAALTKFGTENNIRVIIDRLSGEIKIQKVLDIVEQVEDTSKQIILNDAKSINKKNADLKVGDQIFEDLPQIDFGRIAAQSAKQVISLRVKEASNFKICIFFVYRFCIVENNLFTCILNLFNYI